MKDKVKANIITEKLAIDDLLLQLASGGGVDNLGDPVEVRELGRDSEDGVVDPGAIGEETVEIEAELNKYCALLR